MKNNIGRLSAFIFGFLITIMFAILVSFVLTSLYRMENTISGDVYTVLNIEKNSDNEVKIVALNKKYIFNIDEISKNTINYSSFDVLIPSEIRTFFCLVKSGADIVETWFCSMLK